jgi:hypothetical protein
MSGSIATFVTDDSPNQWGGPEGAIDHSRHHGLSLLPPQHAWDQVFATELQENNWLMKIKMSVAAVTPGADKLSTIEEIE